MVTPVLLFHHCLHAPSCHPLPLVSPEQSDDGEEELRAIDDSEHFYQKQHYIHDDMIDASPGLHPSNAQDLDDEMSTITNTEKFTKEQDKKENVVARSEIKQFSRTRKPYKL
jgi:hypothetical protein